jgi:hypothetical protein
MSASDAAAKHCLKRPHRLHGSLLISGSFNSAHICGTHVPVEEPSTASKAEVEVTDKDFCSTPTVSTYRRNTLS